jgi:hypothetical protein
VTRDAFVPIILHDGAVRHNNDQFGAGFLGDPGDLGIGAYAMRDEGLRMQIAGFD